MNEYGDGMFSQIVSARTKGKGNPPCMFCTVMSNDHVFRNYIISFIKRPKTRCDKYNCFYFFLYTKIIYVIHFVNICICICITKIQISNVGLSKLLCYFMYSQTHKFNNIV